MEKITVNTEFDAGSIEIIDISKLQFKIRKDTNSHFAQWFYFQLNNVENKELAITISDLKNSAYPEGWKNYNVCASYDNEYWFRVKSVFDKDNLNFKIIPTEKSIYFAYFEPYSYERHLELINYANQSDMANHTVLGSTVEGRNIDLITIGDIKAKYKVWIIARQHPGETMAEWFMEGLIDKLLDEQDATSKALINNCVFYLVPNMNPDGAFNGNLRTNSLGINLNREWLNPVEKKSPEVLYVRQKMMETGVDVFFDIHGDEAIPYVFTAGCEENPSFSEKQNKLSKLFIEYFTLINPDYQTKYGYEKGHFNAETATMATNWVGNQFDCLAFTLEMPFKDNDNLPDHITGWNGYRSYLMGQSILIGINCIIKIL